MPSFFFNRTPARERALQEAQIPFEQLTSYGRRGLVVNNSHIRPALVAMRSRVESRTSTEYDGIAELTLVRVTDISQAVLPVEVTIAEWNERGGNNRYPETFVDILRREYTGKLKYDEIVIIQRGDSDTPVPLQPQEGVFKIIFWSSPVGSADSSNSPRELFGLRIGDAGYWRNWPLSGLGVPITDLDGINVAELIGDSLYILYPLQNRDFGNRADIFRKILDEAVLLRNLSPEEYAAMQAERNAHMLAESRAHYITACNGRLESNIVATQRSIVDGKARVATLQKELVVCIRETNGAERKLEQLIASQGSMAEAFGKEFDRMQSMPKVIRVDAKRDHIRVYTEVLYCVDTRSGKRHEIGAFRIDMYLNGTVRWFNLSRRVRGMNAPHVFSGGDACLGNVDEIIPELAANYEFAALAMVAIQFVESVNVDDSAGRLINEWPVAA